VQGETQSYSAGKNNGIEALSVECIWNTGRTVWSVSHKGWVTLIEEFRGKGASPTNHYWCQSSRVITLSWGAKISTVYHLVLSQYTHLTDRRTDGQTDRQTELRQQYRALRWTVKIKVCNIAHISAVTVNWFDRKAQFKCLPLIFPLISHSGSYFPFVKF